VPGVPAGDRPPESVKVPFYVGQYLAWAVGAAAIGGGLVALLRRILRRRDGPRQ
jgi:hypothetical protein